MRLYLIAAVIAAVGSFTAPASPQLRTSSRSRSATPTMMPIGVPKVAYRVPGAASADWVGIYDRLYRERICFLGSEIDDEVCNQLIATMLFADSEDPEKPMYLYVNSPGGSVIAGLALYDTIGHINSEVVTVNVGMAASMASFILGAGVRGKRVALHSGPNKVARNVEQRAKHARAEAGGQLRALHRGRRARPRGSAA